MNKKQLLLTTLLGLIAGLAGSLLTRREPPRATDARVSEDTSIAARGSEGRRVVDYLHSAAEEDRARRLAALEARVDESERARSAPGPDQEEVPPPLSPEDALEETVAAWDERLDGHGAEARDGAWAPAAELALAADVQSLSDTAQVRVLGTDCRTTTCTSTLEWKDYGSAVEHYTTLLHHPYKNNCAREVLMPPPENREAPYRATVLYDCSSLRKSS